MEGSESVTPTNVINNKENAGIDLAKLLCAVLVMIIHIPLLPETSSGSAINSVIQHGIALIAVPFFFICNGFFLEEKSKNGEERKIVKDYLKKMLRLYVIWSIIYFPLSVHSLLEMSGSWTDRLMWYIKRIFLVGSYQHLWYVLAVIIGVAIERYVHQCVKNTERTLIIATGLYLLGLLAQTWFGLIKPLQELWPDLWQILLSVKDIIGTTRNGLFEGFFFICVGRLISEKRTSFGRYAWPLLFFSIVLIYLELYFVNELKLARTYDMMLTTPLAAICLFDVAHNSHFTSRFSYLVRKLSTLMFFTHLWIDAAVNLVLSHINHPMLTSLRFLISLSLTLIISLVIIRGSKWRRLSFLKALY